MAVDEIAARQREPLTRICVIGASAGGVRALQRFFETVDENLGLAYVVVVHSSPDEESQLGGILAGRTGMPVVQVGETPSLKPNCVYVIAPDREVVIEGNTLVSRPFAEPRGQRAPIDMVFRSVADGRGDGFAVVLSGAGSDGAVGVRRIKEAGGVVFVQDPAEAEHGMMPRSAIATGVADVVEPVARIVERIAEVARSEDARRRLANAAKPKSERGVDHLTQLPRAQRPHLSDGRSQDNERQTEPSPALHAAALEELAPPSVLIDGEHRILGLSKTAGRYIRPPEGPPGSALSAVVRPELRAELGSALDHAFASGEPVMTLPVSVGFNGTERRVVLHVQPVTVEGDRGRRALVLFIDTGPAATETPATSSHDHPGAAERIRRLEDELRATQDRLSATRHEHESSMHELSIANRELQSINEELSTVNSELKVRLDAIAAAHRDLQNLISATEIGALFLDARLRIKMLTPAVEQLLGVTDSDVGRPISDFTHDLVYEGVEADAARVLRDHVPVESEAETRDGRWLMMRMRPHRTVADRIGGLVLSLVDITERRALERRLRESEDRHRSLFETMGQGYFLNEIVRDEQGRAIDFRYIELNTAFERLTGLSAAEARGRTATEVFGAVDARRLEVADQVIRSGQSQRIEHHVPAVARWYEAYYYPASGGRLIGIYDDITERKQAEDTLRQSEGRKAFLLDLSDALRSSSDPSDITRAATRLVGERLKATRACYVTWREGEDQGDVSPDYAVPGVPSLEGRHRVDVFTSACGTLARGDTWIVGDAARADLDAAEREHFRGLGVEAWVAVPLAKNGVLQAALCVGQDEPRDWTSDEIALIEEVADRCWAAVERRRAEVALRESEARFRRIAEANLVGVAFGNARGDIHSLNDEMLRMMGRTRAEFEKGQVSWIETVAPEDRQQIAEMLKAVARDGAVAGFERSFLRPDGEKTRFIGSFALTTPGQDTHVGLALDVTERAEAEERQSMLMAELDHRVKNILALVQSLARQSLEHGQAIRPEVADQLIGRIDALARFHTLLASSHWDGARFGALVESAVAPYRGERDDRVTTDGPVLKVRPKAAQTLTLALHELVTNAAKYGALSTDEGRVTAEWHLVGGEEDRHLVFLWQEHGGPPIEETPNRAGFGSRVIEKTLAYELGGEVTLDFRRDGLRAVIDMPLGRLHAQAIRGTGGLRRAEHPAAGDPAILQGKRVLLVEDVHLVGEEAVEALYSAGCVVTGPAGTLQEALRVAATEELDAAVLDINLNGDLVWPAAHALRARGIPIVFTTGYSHEIEVPSELEDIPRIDKPVRLADLLSTLATVISGRAADGLAQL